MIQKEFINKKQINIIVVLNKNSNLELFQNIFDYISIYLKLNVMYIKNFDTKKIQEVNDKLNEKIDFYFVDIIKEYEYIFSWNFYSKMHSFNNLFKLIVFKNQIDDDDIKYYKNGVDDIVYMSDKYYSDKEKYIKWKIFSLLRRKWDNYHKDTTLIRNGVIIDLIKRQVVVNNKNIKITNKEFEVLNILIIEFNKKNNFSSKNKLYKKIYGVENKENSRVIDQLIFRLKNKISNGFFEIDKRKGIRIA
ncbi:winged helix-turn-helix domain-containing protein [Mesomycoplasma moatsii]|uniref:winged helix-turn-helix domain-containing protein n=1 Tax=Mesomycoplasma moatsii TaxID=171287 RepID=UPI0003B6661F